MSCEHLLSSELPVQALRCAKITEKESELPWRDGFSNLGIQPRNSVHAT